MKLYYVITSVFLFVLSDVNAQNFQTISAIDSTIIDLRDKSLENESIKYAKILKKDEKIFFLTSDTRLLYVIDLQTGTMKEMFHSHKSIKSNRILNFELGDSSIYVVNDKMDFIIEFNFDGAYKRRIRLNYLFSSQYFSGRESFAYNKFRNSFYVKNEESSPEDKMISKPEKAKTFFRRSDLIVEVDQKGRPLDKFGSFDSLYLNHFYFHGDFFGFVTDNSGNLIFFQELSNKILVYSSSGTEIKRLDFKGRYISMNDGQLPISKRPYFEIEDFYHDVITSYQYTFVELLNGSQLLYRVYRDGGFDSTISAVFPSLEYSTDKNMCLTPSPRKLAQIELLHRKPIYLQIINYQQGALLYDGPFVFRGDYLLPSKDQNPDIFYSYSWSGSKFKLYKYYVGSLSAINLNTVR